jgi:hypothetical protein
MRGGAKAPLPLGRVSHLIWDFPQGNALVVAASHLAGDWGETFPGRMSAATRRL